MTPQGPVTIPSLSVPLKMLSLQDGMPMPVDAYEVPCTLLSRDEVTALSRMMAECDRQILEARAKATGITLAASMPRGKP